MPWVEWLWLAPATCNLIGCYMPIPIIGLCLPQTLLTYYCSGWQLPKQAVCALLRARAFQGGGGGGGRAGQAGVGWGQYYPGPSLPTYL